MNISLVLFLVSLIGILSYFIIKILQNSNLGLLKQRCDVLRIVAIIEAGGNLNRRLRGLKTLAAIRQVDTTPALIRILQNRNLDI